MKAALTRRRRRRKPIRAPTGFLSLLGDDAVFREILQAALERRTRGDREQRVFLRAAGYLKIALVGLEDIDSGAVPAPAAAPTPAAPGP